MNDEQMHRAAILRRIICEKFSLSECTLTVTSGRSDEIYGVNPRTMNPDTRRAVAEFAEVAAPALWLTIRYPHYSDGLELALARYPVSAQDLATGRAAVEEVFRQRSERHLRG